jgi:HK97 gp10 family phage protein
MSDDITFKITGIKEIIDELDAFPPRVAQAAEKKGLRKGATIIRDAAKQKVPVKSGKLRESIRIKAQRRSKYLRVSVIAGAPHAHLMEYGYRLTTHGTGKGTGTFIQDVGKQGEHAFMRPALDEHRTDVVEAVRDTIVKVVGTLKAKL